MRDSQNPYGGLQNPLAICMVGPSPPTPCNAACATFNGSQFATMRKGGYAHSQNWSYHRIWTNKGISHGNASYLSGFSAAAWALTLPKQGAPTSVVSMMLSLLCLLLDRMDR